MGFPICVFPSFPLVSELFLLDTFVDVPFWLGRALAGALGSSGGALECFFSCFVEALKTLFALVSRLCCYSHGVGDGWRRRRQRRSFDHVGVVAIWIFDPAFTVEGIGGREASEIVVELGQGGVVGGLVVGVKVDNWLAYWEVLRDC